MNELINVMRRLLNQLTKNVCTSNELSQLLLPRDENHVLYFWRKIEVFLDLANSV